MEPLSLSKADLFFPLIADSPEDSGGSISLQNILDLKENGMLGALRNLQISIARTRAQSGLYDDTLHEEPLLHGFFKFIKAAYEVSEAKRVVDSGHALTVTREDDSVIALEGNIFYLTPLRESLMHIQERYGRRDVEDFYGAYGVPKSIERVIAMTKWYVMKNHAFDYLMTFEVSLVPGTRDIMIRVPEFEGPKWKD